QRRQQEYMRFQETEAAKLENETTQHLEVLSNRINDAAEKFSKENGIDILMMQGMGSGLTYITSKMDVTQAFIAYLNKYQAQLDKEIGTKK
ncbi:MAG TPA: OmpH family outer membrane protein, partial [Crocinitomicaceae bacterium]|nr:OmpH family outer membrane protein [Crocinitomicaceae bacterium]